MNRFEKTFTSFFIIACFLLATPVKAAGKFATVDMARVLREWVEVKKVAAWLQKKKDEYQEAIDEKQLAIKKINDEMQESATPAAKKKDLEKAKKKKLRELQDEFQKLKIKLAELEKDEFDRIKKRIYAEIDNIVGRRNLEMVFEKQWLYYPRDASDITDELLQILDAQSSKSGSKGQDSEGSDEGTEETPKKKKTEE